MGGRGSLVWNPAWLLWGDKQHYVMSTARWEFPSLLMSQVALGGQLHSLWNMHVCNHNLFLRKRKGKKNQCLSTLRLHIRAGTCAGPISWEHQRLRIWTAVHTSWCCGVEFKYTQVFLEHCSHTSGEWYHHCHHARILACMHCIACIALSGFRLPMQENIHLARQKGDQECKTEATHEAVTVGQSLVVDTPTHRPHSARRQLTFAENVDPPGDTLANVATPEADAPGSDVA